MSRSTYRRKRESTLLKFGVIPRSAWFHVALMSRNATSPTLAYIANSRVPGLPIGMFRDLSPSEDNDFAVAETRSRRLISDMATNGVPFLSSPSSQKSSSSVDGVAPATMTVSHLMRPRSQWEGTGLIPP